MAEQEAREWAEVRNVAISAVEEAAADAAYGEGEDRTQAVMAKPFRILVTGSRSWGDVDTLVWHRVAKPGDPDLDLHLFGLRLGPVVIAPVSDYTMEATIAFDVTEAAGWWTDQQTGERFVPDKVTHLDCTFGFNLEEGYGHLAVAMMNRLTAWAKDQSLFAMTSAPGKWTLLHCPGHPAGTCVVFPRSAPKEEA